MEANVSLSTYVRYTMHPLELAHYTTVYTNRHTAEKKVIVYGKKKVVAGNPNSLFINNYMKI